VDKRNKKKEKETRKNRKKKEKETRKKRETICFKYKKKEFDFIYNTVETGIKTLPYCRDRKKFNFRSEN
jgi:hypothetical protein